MTSTQARMPMASIFQDLFMAAPYTLPTGDFQYTAL